MRVPDRATLLRRRPAARRRRTPSPGAGLRPLRATSRSLARRRRSTWRPAAASAATTTCCVRRDARSAPTAGMRVLDGPLGRAVIKVSRGRRPSTASSTAPARGLRRPGTTSSRRFEPRASSTATSSRSIRFQGPRANGMPELHKLTPALGVLQDRGHKVALVTDGRMSGASGKVPGRHPPAPPRPRRGGPLGAPARRRHHHASTPTTGRLELSTSTSASASRPVTRPAARRTQRHRPRAVRRLPRAAVGRADTGAIDLPGRTSPRPEIAC